MKKVKTVDLWLKVQDQFNCSFLDKDRNEIASYERYVPKWMPEKHYGDLVILKIDVETGKILNWKKDASILIEEELLELMEVRNNKMGL